MPRAKTKPPDHSILLEQLKEAMEVGNTRKVKSLTKKIADIVSVPIGPAKPKRKYIRKPKPKVIDVNDESSYIARARPQLQGASNQDAGRKFIGEDGSEHMFCKLVPVNTSKKIHKNKFVDDGKLQLPPNHAKVEQKFKKIKTTVRPGHKGSLRDKAETIKIECSKCHHQVECYPWECEKLDSESEFLCNECTVGKKRRRYNG